MDLSLIVGLVGALILVVGAAYPVEKTKKPYKSVKNRLFAVGGVTMLVYAILGYLSGGSVFFIFLQTLIVLASILMMLNTNDRTDTWILGASGLVLIALSMYMFEGYSTIIFVLGLAGLGLGYAFKMDTLRRDVALMIGGILVAVFSYLGANWIFFWLNIFFALFSLYYTIKFFYVKKKNIHKQHDFMGEAILLSARNITEKNGGPFGAVIVKDGQIVGRGYNHVVGNNDPTAHGEVMAIRDACQNLGTFDLNGCEIYTSCEPCPMCLGAIYRARLGKIYYANTEQDAHDIGFDDEIFYDEFSKPAAQRKVPTVQIEHAAARAVFDKRKQEINDIKY